MKKEFKDNFTNIINYMAALINAIDNSTSLRIGENGHIELDWSNQFEDKIVQVHFQLVRGANDSIIKKYQELLSETQNKYNLNKINYAEYMQSLSILYRMVGFTRDIISGKGEYKLAYDLLNIWSEFNIELAKYALRTFVLFDSDHQYGSWKDIKGFWKTSHNSEMAAYMVTLVNEQLRKDMESDSPSLLAKWVPREKTNWENGDANGNLYERLATDYFASYIQTAKLNPDKLKRAIKKAKMEYRKIISGLNKKLDTVQIKQCANTWAEIKPYNQTSITMQKQRKAFFNKTKRGDDRSDKEDRILCADHFKEFVEKAVNGEVTVKGKRVSLVDFAKEALLSDKLSEIEINLINKQWEDNSTQNNALDKIIAMVDVSGSMNGDPLFAAISLGIRVAEKSMLGKRVLTFSGKPNWVNLDDCDGFVSMANKLKRADWGMNTNFYAALDMILQATVQSKLEPADVEDMILCVFSDMQIDDALDTSQRNGNYFDTMYKVMEQKYSEAGIAACGRAYKPPHILFWNLRSTSGFPSLSRQLNTSMMSGFSPVLLNVFCEGGVDALKKSTPYNTFINLIDNKRYEPLDSKLREIIKN